jgi:recombination protein RecA
MPSATALRAQIEASLTNRIPSALTPAPRMIRPRCSTGIPRVDELTEGGFPLGAITEISGQASSGRTTLALSFLRQVTQAAKVCAWIDMSDSLQPESAVAAGIDLARLLWVRCGVTASASPGNYNTSGASGFELPGKYLVPPAVKRGLHGGGFGPHPRSEIKGLSQSVGNLLQREAIAPRCAEAQRSMRPEPTRFEPIPMPQRSEPARSPRPGKPWSRIEQGLRVADLLLQAGGFSAIVLDMADIPAEAATRVPLATWFRYRAAAERMQSSILLLTQQPCAKSSAEVVLRLRAGEAICEEPTVLTSFAYDVEATRKRFVSTAKVVPVRKPAQRESVTEWRSRMLWGSR